MNDGVDIEKQGGRRSHRELDIEALPVGMTDQQLAAADHLVAGLRPGLVAKRVDISREQLWRWRTKDRAFIEHCQRLRFELHASRVDRTWGLVDTALDVVEESLKEGDAHTAMQVLRLPGLNLSDADPQGI
jgi:hypothetical protein